MDATFKTKPVDPDCAGDADLAAQARFEEHSKGPVAAVFRDGMVVALHGRFPTKATSAFEAATTFLRDQADALGIDVESGGFGKPERVGCFAKQFSDDTETVFFPHSAQGLSSYRGGLALAVDRAGAVRALTATISSPVRGLKDRDPGRAVKAVTAFLGRTPPDPTLYGLDPERVFGVPGDPYGVWVFEIRGDKRLQILVKAGSDEVYRVISNPGCPVGPLPIYKVNPATQAPDFMMFPFPGLLLAESVTRDPVAVARSLFARYPELFGTGDAAAQLALVDVLSGPDPLLPTTTVIFAQRWSGIPVFGCQLRVHLSKALAILSVSGNFLRDPAVPITPEVSQSTARVTASTTTIVDAGQVSDVGINGDLRRKLWTHHKNHGHAVTIPGAEDRGLVVLATALTRSGLGANHLAWWFRFPDADRFISATTGALVLRLSRLHTAERVFDAQQVTNPTATNPQFVDGVPQVPAASQDAEAGPASGAVSVINAFWRGLRRESWDGLGGNMDSFVDWLSPTGPNAQWDGRRTKYSPGFAVPDVIGHEFTHAVTNATSNLAMLDESGAANEHYSDLFGNLIFPDAAPGQWLVGELMPGGAIRDMRAPAVGTYQNYLVQQPSVDSGGVHTNCGILNRAAVLLCDGNAPAVAGIGRSRLARLYWETLVFRLHPLATFTDVFHVTWGLANELAASGARGAPNVPGEIGVPPLFDQAVVTTVSWAFQQVGINLDVQLGWSDVTVNTPFDTNPGGGFVANVTLYEGMTLQDGRLLADMSIRLFRRNVLNGSFLVSAGAFNAPDGSFSATVTESHLNTADLQTGIQITSPTALTVQVEGVPTYQEPAGVPQPPVDEPPIGTQDTPVVRHWHDLGLGGKYDERIFEGAQLPEGSFVTNVELFLLDVNESSLGSTMNVDGRVGDSTRGVKLSARTLGGRSLQAEVHSWYEGGYVVRYKLRYTIGGSGGLPDFTIKDITVYPTDSLPPLEWPSFP